MSLSEWGRLFLTQNSRLITQDSKGPLRPAKNTGFQGRARFTMRKRATGLDLSRTDHDDLSLIAIKHKIVDFVNEEACQLCAGCRHQVSLTSGTMLHRTKMLLTHWLTACMMLHKLRRAMLSAPREPL